MHVLTVGTVPTTWTFRKTKNASFSVTVELKVTLQSDGTAHRLMNLVLVV